MRPVGQVMQKIDSQMLLLTASNIIERVDNENWHMRPEAEQLNCDTTST